MDYAQIEAEMQRRINEVWPPAKREKAMRTGKGLDELNSFFVEMGEQKKELVKVLEDELAAIAELAALAKVEPESVIQPETEPEQPV